MIGEQLRDQWEKNYLKNKPRIKQVIEEQVFTPSVAKPSDLRPALCVGAGPSLNKNIDQIDPFLYEIVACDKTVPRLWDKKMFPQYIVALNSVPTDVRKWLEPAVNKSKLVVPCVVWPETLDGWDDEHILFINSENATGIHERIEAELGIPRLVIGSNAGTFAYIVACYSFHNPVAYVGMDFSFTSRAAVIDRQDPRRYTLVEMTDSNGDVRYLDIGWLDMADAFQTWVKFFQEWGGISTVNCTEGGINYSQYTEQMTLMQFNQRLLGQDEARGEQRRYDFG